MFILLHGGLETIILFVFGEELYNKYKINNNKKQQKSIDKINFNVYNKDKKYLFSFREKSSIMDILLKKNPHIQIVDRLEDYHV